MTVTAIVGNADMTTDRSARIDAADTVIRFNEPNGWGQLAGRKFDIWVLANGNGGRKFIKKLMFADRPFRDLPTEVWFSRDMSVHADINTADEAFLRELGEKDLGVRILKRNGMTQPARHMDKAIYLDCIDMIRTRIPAGRPMQLPSAGFLAIETVLRTRPDDHIVLAGFGFEGGAIHPWDIERAHITQLAEAGRVEMLAP